MGKRKRKRKQQKSKKSKETIIIFCEGKTEAIYFKSFPVENLNVTTVDLEGKTGNLIQKVQERLKALGKFDQVWCVFDYDYNPSTANQGNDFDRLIQLGKKENYHMAYSNDAFELWYCLHFQYITHSHNRKEYYNRLSKQWEIDYSKQGKQTAFAQKIYDKLKDKQGDAIDNAIKLDSSYKGVPPHQQNPVTKVYKLVELLNKYLT